MFRRTTTRKPMHRPAQPFPRIVTAFRVARFLLILIVFSVSFETSRNARAGEAPHGEPDLHGGHAEAGEHAEPQAIRLTEPQMREFGISTEPAGAARIALQVELPGEVRANQDRLAHLAPRFPGIVQEVRKRVGDSVAQGETLALIESSESLAGYPLRSLIDGIVIAKHITRGEAVSTESETYVIADLGSVWIDLSVYQRDLDRVRAGQPVRIDAGLPGLRADAVLSYVAPVVDERTRTAVARAVVMNDQGRWRPGLFVTGIVTVEEADVPVTVPPAALQRYRGSQVLFVPTLDGFRPRRVQTGRRDTNHVEITRGLTAGELVVSRGGFLLKSELEKAGFEAGHGH